MDGIMKSEVDAPSTTHPSPMSTWIFMLNQAKRGCQGAQSQGRPTFGWPWLVHEFEFICERLKLLLLAMSTTHGEGQFGRDLLVMPDCLRQALNLGPDQTTTYYFKAKDHIQWPNEAVHDGDWLLPEAQGQESLPDVQSLVFDLDLDDEDGICWDSEEEKREHFQVLPDVSTVEGSNQSVRDYSEIHLFGSDPDRLGGPTVSDVVPHGKKCSEPLELESSHTMLTPRKCRTRNAGSSVLPLKEVSRFIVEVSNQSKSSPDRPLFKCTRCGILRKVKASMVAHVRICLVTCPRCQKVFRRETPDWLRKHETSCQTSSIVKPDNSSTSESLDLTRVQADHADSDLSSKAQNALSRLEVKRCNVCDKVFTSSKSLASFLEHQAVCQNKRRLAPFFNADKGLYECACTHTGLRLGYFYRHVRTCIQLPKCLKCERRFHHSTPKTVVQDHEATCQGQWDNMDIKDGSIFDSKSKNSDEVTTVTQQPRSESLEAKCPQNSPEAKKPGDCQSGGVPVDNLEVRAFESQEGRLCRFCDRRFPKNFKHFDRHEARCQRILNNKGIVPPHQILDNEYLCTFPKCTNNENSFQTYEMLQIHFTREHIEAQDLPHKCTICDERFISRAFMTRHRFRHKERYTCDTCGKGFVERMALSRHIVSHSSEKGHVCPKEGCDYKTNLKDTLNRHLRKVHNEMLGANHFCEKCGRSFLSRPALELHRVKVHINPKPKKLHQCPRCDFKTTKTSMLRQHVEYRCQFDGTNKCVCSTCGKALKTKESLRDHVKTVHLKIFSPGQIRKREKARRNYHEAKTVNDDQLTNLLDLE